MKATLHTDGGARGNPGPAGIGAVLYDEDGNEIASLAESLPATTNNVAEYKGLLLELELARRLGATEVEVINDSELVARQVNGSYRVKHPDMKPLHADAMRELAAFERWSIRSVPRARNAEADRLVNEALDALG